MFKARREHLRFMKNKYISKILCVSLAATMVLSSPMKIFATEMTAEGVSDASVVEASDLFTDQPIETPMPTPTPVPQVTEEPVVTPETTITPEVTVAPTPVTPAPDVPVTPEATVTPAPEVNETPTPTPGVTEIPTPTPGVSETPTPTPDASVTPTPGVSVTPEPDENVTPTPIPEKIQSIINRLTALAELGEINKLEQITPELEKEVLGLRAAYEALSEEDKLLIENYDVLLYFEKKITELKSEENLKDSIDIDVNFGSENVSKGEEALEEIFTDKETTESLLTDGLSVQVGTPVYYTNMVSNIHAGKEFYLDSLKNNYQLVFAENFSAVMDEIESNYKKRNNLTDASDLRDNKITASSDSLLVRNWQDIIAIYVYEQSKKGIKEFTLDASCKEDLARIFAEMNPLIKDKQNENHVSYANRHINYYIKKYDISQEDRAVLKKYTETDCKLLCATVTAAKGFVRQSVGDQVSEERVNVISAAYSLVGKVGYFWGGKSNVIGEDATWGTAERVTAEGSSSTGTMRAFGLDCSGFVTWAVINGYKNQGMEGTIGHGTSTQWVNANVVSEADAQPGDLVFQRGPEAGSDNHVGIICGQTDAGDWIAVHCSSSKNGVTVGEAYGASFRYIRQPSFYPTKAELEQMISDGAKADNTSAVYGSEDFAAVTESFAGVTTNAGVVTGSDAFTDQAEIIPDAGASNAEEDDIFVSFDEIDEEVFYSDETGSSVPVSSDGTVQVTDTLENIVLMPETETQPVSWNGPVLPQMPAMIEAQTDYDAIFIDF